MEKFLGNHWKQIIFIGVGLAVIAGLRKQQQKRLIGKINRIVQMNILLVGMKGAGKKRLFKIIQGLQNRQNQNNQECELVNNYKLVKMPSFDHNQNTEHKQTQYKNFFTASGHLINNLLIVVKYEAIEQMKKKIQFIVDYPLFVGYRIGIVITQLDDNDEIDIENIKGILSAFTKQIIFVKNTITAEVLKQQIISICYIFDLKDTIFEIQDEEEQAAMLNQLALQINQRIYN